MLALSALAATFGGFLAQSLGSVEFLNSLFGSFVALTGDAHQVKVAQDIFRQEIRYERSLQIREDIRDVSKMMLESVQSHLFIGSIILGVCFAMFVEGHPPEDTLRTLEDLWVVLTSWSATFTLLSLWLALCFQAKVSWCARERLLLKHRSQMPDDRLVGRMGGSNLVNQVANFHEDLLGVLKDVMPRDQVPQQNEEKILNAAQILQLASQRRHLCIEVQASDGQALDIDVMRKGMRAWLSDTGEGYCDATILDLPRFLQGATLVRSRWFCRGRRNVHLRVTGDVTLYCAAQCPPVGAKHEDRLRSAFRLGSEVSWPVDQLPRMLQGFHEYWRGNSGYGEFKRVNGHSIYVDHCHLELPLYKIVLQSPPDGGDGKVDFVIKFDFKSGCEAMLLILRKAHIHCKEEDWPILEFNEELRHILPLREYAGMYLKYGVVCLVCAAVFTYFCRVWALEIRPIPGFEVFLLLLSGGPAILALNCVPIQVSTAPPSDVQHGADKMRSSQTGNRASRSTADDLEDEETTDCTASRRRFWSDGTADDARLSACINKDSVASWERQSEESGERRPSKVTNLEGGPSSGDGGGGGGEAVAAAAAGPTTPRLLPLPARAIPEPPADVLWPRRPPFVVAVAKEAQEEEGTVATAPPAHGSADDLSVDAATPRLITGTTTARAYWETDPEVPREARAFGREAHEPQNTDDGRGMDCDSDLEVGCGEAFMCSFTKPPSSFACCGEPEVARLREVVASACGEPQKPTVKRIARRVEVPRQLMREDSMVPSALLQTGMHGMIDACHTSSMAPSMPETSEEEKPKQGWCPLRWPSRPALLQPIDDSSSGIWQIQGGSSESMRYTLHKFHLWAVTLRSLFVVSLLMALASPYVWFSSHDDAAAAVALAAVTDSQGLHPAASLAALPLAWARWEIAWPPLFQPTAAVLLSEILWVAGGGVLRAMGRRAAAGEELLRVAGPPLLLPTSAVGLGATAAGKLVVVGDTGVLQVSTADLLWPDPASQHASKLFAELLDGGASSGTGRLRELPSALAPAAAGAVFRRSALAEATDGGAGGGAGGDDGAGTAPAPVVVVAGGDGAIHLVAAVGTRDDGPLRTLGRLEAIGHPLRNVSALFPCAADVCAPSFVLWVAGVREAGAPISAGARIRSEILAVNVATGDVLAAFDAPPCPGEAADAPCAGGAVVALTGNASHLVAITNMEGRRPALFAAPYPALPWPSASPAEL